MTNWKTDQEVFAAGDRMAKAMMDMLSSDSETWPGSPQIPGSGGDYIMHGLLKDAEYSLSLDPQKISDEYDRIYKLANAISPDRNSDVIDCFRTIDYSIQDWQGDGARAFQRQISMIQGFFGQQYFYLVKTLESLGALMSIATQVREDYISLTAATTSACQKALQQEQEADTKLLIGVGATLVTAAVSAVSGGATLAATANVCINIASAGVQRSIDGSKILEVVKGYTSSRDIMLNNYKGALRTAQDLVARAQDGLNNEKNELFAPLPATMQASSPQFKYEDFYSTANEIGDFNGKVDREHKKIAQPQSGDTSQPQGYIQNVLEGN